MTGSVVRLAVLLFAAAVIAACVASMVLADPAGDPTFHPPTTHGGTP